MSHSNDSGAKRVLFVEANEDGTVGGSHQFLFDHVRALDRTRYVPIVLFYENNRFVDLLRQEGVEVLVWDALRREERRPFREHRRAAMAWCLLRAPVIRARTLRRHRIDLLHLNNSPMVGYHDWLPAAKLVGVRTVCHCMGQYVVPRRSFEAWLTRQHDLVIAISQYIRDTLVEGGVPRERIVTITPGVDVRAFRQRVTQTPTAVRRELGVDDADVMLVMVGNVRRWKGQDILLTALGRIAPEHRRRLKVFFVGAPSHEHREFESHLAAIVERERLDGSVRFLGSRLDVPNLMNAADMVVHSSRVPEPFGLVVVEAMAVGTPILATHFGGPAEIVTEQSGILYDPEQPDELARAIELLVRDPQRREALGAGGRTRALEFDVPRLSEMIQRVYGELLAPAKRRPT